MEMMELMTTIVVPFLVLVFGAVAADAKCHNPKMKIGEVH
jgi:hypothetical protein